MSLSRMHFCRMQNFSGERERKLRIINPDQCSRCIYYEIPPYQHAAGTSWLELGFLAKSYLTCVGRGKSCYRVDIQVSIADEVAADKHCDVAGFHAGKCK